MTHIDYSFENPVTEFSFNNYSDFKKAISFLGDKIKIFEMIYADEKCRVSISDGESSFIIPNDKAENIMNDLLTIVEFETRKIYEYHIKS